MCNTCKRLKEHIPRVYTLRCRLDKLQSEVFNWLQKLSITLAYRPPFHHTWQRRHFEFYAQCGWRKVLLWAVHTRYETLRIVDCPWKAPYECFELDITPAHDDKFASLSHISKRGPLPSKKTRPVFPPMADWESASVTSSAAADGEAFVGSISLRLAACSRSAFALARRRSPPGGGAPPSLPVQTFGPAP